MSDNTADDVTPPIEIDRRDQRFRIAGDPAEALKVVLAQLPE